MKKFYSFLFAAVALVGFAACNSDSTEEPAPTQKENIGKMEFTANIGEATKTALDGLNVVWCEGDQIGIWDGTTTQPFTATEINGGSAKFTGMAALGQEKYYAVYPYVEGATCADGVWSGVNFNNNQEAKADSFACKANISYAESEGTTLNFQNSLAVLKFQVPVECQLVEFFGESGLIVKAWAEAEDMMQPENDYYVTVPAGDYKLTARVDAYLSVASTKTLEVATNKIYNLGVLPEQQKITVYLVPGEWTSDNADFAVYFWNGDSTKDLLMTEDETKSGVYKAEVSVDAELLFKRLDPVNHNVWNQTENLELPTEDGKNFFYFESWDGGKDGNSTGSWGVDPYAPETPDVASNWCVAGAFNGWGDTNVMVTTTVKNLFVAKNITLAAYTDEFKIKVKGTWDGSYGAGEVCYVNKNSNVAAFVSSSTNFAAVEAGTYDIYFEALSGSVYLMVAGTDYTTATKQIVNGPMPDTSSMKWGLCGAHNSWGTPDIPLTWDGTIGMYVAKNAVLTGDFKVRADEAWATSFGNGSNVTPNQSAATTVYNNGGNCKATGTYDVYFWYNKENIKANGKIWIKTPGSAAPTL